MNSATSKARFLNDAILHAARNKRFPLRSPPACLACLAGEEDGVALILSLLNAATASFLNGAQVWVFNGC